MAFNFDESNPTDNSYIADYPANERAARAAKKGAFEVDHELTYGYHTSIHLPEQGANPDPGASIGALYTKDSGSQPELYYQEESAGDVVQITDAGWLNALAFDAGSPDAKRQMAADLILGNTIAITGEKAAGGTFYDLLQLDGSDQIQIGETTASRIQKLLLSVASDVSDPEQQLIFSYGAGEKKVFHEGYMDGIDAATLDGVAAADIPGTYAEVTVDDPVATDTDVSVAHSLGAEPRLVIFMLECKSAELGYGVGDKVPLESLVDWGGGVPTQGAQGWWNATYVGASTRDQLRLISRAGTHNHQDIAVAKWKIIARCWL